MGDCVRYKFTYFAIRYLVPFLVLQSSRCGREGWLLYVCVFLNSMLLSLLFATFFIISMSWVGL